MTASAASVFQEITMNAEALASRPTGVIVVDRCGVGIDASQPDVKAFIAANRHSTIFDVVHPEDRARAMEAFRSVADGFEPSAQARLRFFTGSGELRLMQGLFLAPTNSLRADGIIITYTDVTVSSTVEALRGISQAIAMGDIQDTTKTIEEAFRFAMSATGLTSAALFLRSSRATDPMIFDVERTQHVVEASQEGLHQIGPIHDNMPSVAEALRTRSAVIVNPATSDGPGDDDALWNVLYLDHLPTLYRFVLVPLISGDRCEGIVVFGCTRDTWDLSNSLVEFLGLAGDLIAGALARRRTAIELRDRALTDSLTGLPNRRYLVDRLEEVVARIRRTRSWVALLFVDCDGFKGVNDTHGHEVGDDVLIGVVERLQSVCRSGELIARFGGDEFVVMVESDQPETMVVALGQRIVDVLDSTYIAHGKEVPLSASVGVAVHRGDDPSVDHSALFRRADLAMYRAKEGGRNRVELFTEEMEATTRDRFELIADLKSALNEKDQLSLWFQPVVSMTTGCLTGYEALVRWEHPERGLLFPGSFITLAEESGQIVELGWHVLEVALDRLRSWRSTGVVGETSTMAVNLSVRQLLSDQFQPTIEGILRNSGVPPELLELEVTESIFADRETVVPRLIRLRESGARLSIDDFGTGYSSLAYLRDLPVDSLKIDRSFVERLGTSPRDEAIVATLVRMASELDLATIAEGVETTAQISSLIRVGCTFAQGYYLGRPSPEPIDASTSFELPARSTASLVGWRDSVQRRQPAAASMAMAAPITALPYRLPG
jgi:diguanylate cyclase (GGDEF)-like protein